MSYRSKLSSGARFLIILVLDVFWTTSWWLFCFVCSFSPIILATGFDFLLEKDIHHHLGYMLCNFMYTFYFQNLAFLLLDFNIFYKFSSILSDKIVALILSLFLINDKRVWHNILIFYNLTLLTLLYLSSGLN